MNQSCLSFGFIKGTLSIFNPWRGGWLSRMLEGLSYHNQYRKGRGRGNPRGSAPLCRGARDLLVPGVSFAAFMLLLSSTRESRPGRRAWQSHAHAERPHGGCRGCQPCINSPGVEGRCPSPRQQIKINFTFYPFCAILNRYKQTALPGENRTPWKGRNQDVSCSKRKGGL